MRSLITTAEPRDLIDEAGVRNNVITNGDPAKIIATPDGMGARLHFGK